MKAFVTGATGRIGRLIVEQLLLRGWSLDAFVLPEEDAVFLSQKGVVIFRGDITDRNSIDRAIEQSNPDVLFHLAAYVQLGILGDKKSKERMYNVNVNGTHNVLKSALQHDVKQSVYLSTVAIFGSSGQGSCSINEKTQPHTGNNIGEYGKTKLLSYQEAMKIQDQGLSLLVFMPGIIFGQGIPGTISLLNSLYQGKMRRLPNNYKENSVPLVFSFDLLQAIHAGIERKKFGEKYLLAESIPVPQILAVLTAIMGKKINIKSISYRKAVLLAWFAENFSKVIGRTPRITTHKVNNSFKVYSQRFDTSKAKKELDWKPTPLHEACQLTFDWFLENHLK